MNKTWNLLACILLPLFLLAQPKRPPFTPANERIESHKKKAVLLEKSFVANVPYRSVGPSVHSGRVADLDVRQDDPSHFYVAYASGGLWKTENNGQSFTPIFDGEMVMTIGDIAVDWERNVVWVGTGEVNSSRSSYAGAGMFRSADGGKIWEHKGLPESHHIGRVLLHPTDPNTLWVAALGHLYSTNPERGVYKTNDGGNTWRRVLFVDGNTGAVDLLADPLDPNVLYATTWHRERYAWDFVESGTGSGIYRSDDGGETWSLLTRNGRGFPTGKDMGRTGLAANVQNGKTILFAVNDNQVRRPKEAAKDKKDVLTKDQLRTMPPSVFLKLDKKMVEKYLKDNRFPEKYDAEKVMDMVRKNEIKPAALVEFLEEANAAHFDTEVTGAEVYRSDDGGKTWQKTHDGYLDDFYYSFGYYFGQIRTSPHSPDRLYLLGVPIITSGDGGKTWKSINQDNVHVDHHALWVNPRREGHLVLGNDGGVNISYDGGENWIMCNTPPVGQFYTVAVDMEKPYNVYGGLQDNGVWYGPSNYKAGTGWHANGQYPYKSLLGGDGMQVAIDSRDNNTVFTGFQFGNYFRIDRRTGKRERISPAHALGERPLRWNWQTPIHLSVHNQDILYIGSNKIHRSLNQGKDWQTLSGDLTKGGKPGDVPYGTLTSIHESPLKFGLLYAGSDDGLIHRSMDGGHTWTNITGSLPPDLWVSRVQASQHAEGRVLLSLNGYRWDDFRSLIYLSDDHGATWKRIGTDLPLEPVNVLKEDPKNPDLLYVGTDHGLYISLDLGKNFMLMNKDLPAVPVHDLVVHPRDNDLVLGTHGRSIYIANVEHVQLLVDSILAQPLFVFDPGKTRYRSNWGNPWSTWSTEAPEPEVLFPVFTDKPGTLKVSVHFGDLALKNWTMDAAKGLQYVAYNATFQEDAVEEYERLLNEKRKKGEDEINIEQAKNGKYYLQKGSYRIVFEKDNIQKETTWTIE